MFGYSDFAHRCIEVNPGIHQLGCVIVYGLHGVTHRGDLFGDAVGALDRSEVARDQPLRCVCQHGVERLDVEKRIAIPIAADGHEVWNVAEQWPEQVAAEKDSIFR